MRTLLIFIKIKLNIIIEIIIIKYRKHCPVCKEALLSVYNFYVNRSFYCPHCDLATFFINPISVFASENENTLIENNSVMMIDNEMECSNFKDHIVMLKEHRLDIINKLKNDKITQEQAVMHIKHINQMINSHK